MARPTNDRSTNLPIYQSTNLPTYQMVQTDALVTDVESCGPFARVALSAPEVARGLSPGRFALADLGSYLRTPLFPSSLDPSGPEGGSFDVLVPPDHPAAALQAGARVDLIGPLGRGFTVNAEARRLLLVADTAHLPVLLPLASQRSAEGRTSSASLGRGVALLLSAPTAAELYPVRLLPPALEVHVVTADGSAGHRGSVLDRFPDLVRWADTVCVASDPATYRPLAEIVRQVRVGPGRRFAQALVVPPMACGVGACQGCAVPTARATKLACTDGPVFDLLELR
jgi:dihydroorotate dehydrogenase electron transfer subunit